MRKLLWAFAVSLVLIGPALYATENPAQYYQNDEVSLRAEPPEEGGDSCRQECAEDGADPDECQMDCNTVT
jgi:hypothetical protein